MLGPLAVAKLREYSDWPTPECTLNSQHSQKVKRGRAPQKPRTKEGRGDQSKRSLYCTQGQLARVRRERMLSALWGRTHTSRTGPGTASPPSGPHLAPHSFPLCAPLTFFRGLVEKTVLNDLVKTSSLLLGACLSVRGQTLRQ